MIETKDVYTEQETIDFLDQRLPQLKETNSEDFDEIKIMMLEAIKKAVMCREKENKVALTTPEIFGNLQYSPRAIEKSGGKPFILDSSDARKEGLFNEELFQKLKYLVCSIFKNLEQEIDKFVFSHGEEIEKILQQKGNIVFICTHPSWYGLITPTLFMEKIEKAVLEKSLISLITAIGPLMVEKEIMGMKINPQGLLETLGVNVLKTVPHKKEYETNDEVLSFGNTMRYKFNREFIQERGKMKRDGGRSIIIAPEGTTTPVSKKDGKYEIASIDPETEHLLTIAGEVPNTYFVVVGISEENKNRVNDLVPTNVEIQTKLISPIEIQEQIKLGTLAKTLRKDMAELVNGRVQQDKKSPEQSDNIS